MKGELSADGQKHYSGTVMNVIVRSSMPSIYASCEQFAYMCTRRSYRSSRRPILSGRFRVGLVSRSSMPDILSIGNAISHIPRC